MTELFLCIKGKGPRKNMEDYGKRGILRRNQASWFIVCDGMGGHPGGGEAARICSSTLHQFLKQSIQSGDYNSGATLIKRGLVDVAENIQKHILEDMSHLMMGTTLCGLLRLKEETIVFWSGDSRIFQYRNNQCIWSSIPHNPVFEEWRAGHTRITDAEKRKTPVLSRYIDGTHCFPFVETETITIRPKDRFIVCTDGVWNEFSRNELCRIMTHVDFGHPVKILNQRLTKSASDNYFAWLIRYI